MQRHNFQHDGLNFSYLGDGDGDGGNGAPLIALHAHWMEGATYATLAKALAPEYRVIALDQRGHGHSDHAPTYEREDYLGDLQAFYAHLGIKQAVLIGNSLGGVNAYQFAARYPAQVRGLVVEDIGAEVHDDLNFILKWGGTFKTRQELEERIGERLVPYLIDSFRQTADGWRLAFDVNDMIVSQNHLKGDHWKDWLASTCPALLIRGAESRVSKAELFEAMAARRPNTQLKVLKAGHVVHQDLTEEFAQAVRVFLQSL
ncbi:MAG TPA: alpha/beta hydrolase [Terriglobales bacterium]